jgi:hypothetical protein
VELDEAVFHNTDFSSIHKMGNNCLMDQSQNSFDAKKDEHIS